MIGTKVAIGGGIAVLGVLCWLAAAGVTVLVPLLVTAAALVVMVGGGNWLGGRTSHRPPYRAEADDPTSPGSSSPAEADDRTSGGPS
jgi:hypothetical protein